MGFTETLKMIVTADTSQAASAFQKLGAQAEGDLAKAEAGTSKLDAGMKIVNANVVPIAGAVAVGLFKLATEFQNAALEAGYFSTVTGVTTQKASALINVSNDLGVSTEGLQKAMALMLKAAGNTPKVFADLGIEIAKTKDGAVDSNATFERVIDRLNGMKDPAERAAAGAKLLGRGWQEVAPLIDAGSASLREMEDSVPKGEIFSPEDVAKAKEMKASFKDLGDAAQNFGLVIGRVVVPELVASAKALTDVLTVAGKVNDKFGILSKAQWVGDLVTGRSIIGDFTDKMSLLGDAITGTAHQTDASRKFYADAAKAHAGYGQGLIDNAKEVAELSRAQDAQLAVNQGYGQGLIDNAAKLADTKAAAKEAADHVKELSDEFKINAEVAKNEQAAIEAETKAMEDNAKALQDDAKAMNDLIKSAEDLAGATEDLSKATDEWNVFLSEEDAAIKEVNKSKDSATVKQAKLNDIYREGIDKAKAIADARVAERVAQDQLNGATTTATTKIDLQNQSMIQQASQAKGPQRDAILGYIADLNAIPKETVAKIKADLLRGDIDAANAELAAASKTRTAGIKADADTAQAEKELDYAARNRTVTIKTQVNPSGSSKGVGGVDDTIGPGRASGGSTWPGTIFPVNEGGKPEVYQEGNNRYLLPGGNGQVTPFGASSAGGAVGGGAPVYNIVVNAGLGTNGQSVGAQILEAIAKENRLRGIR